MNVIKVGIVLGALLLSARVGAAQENQDELKNKILQKVEDRLRAEEERILKEISKIIEEELSGWKSGEKKTVVKPKKEKKAPTKKEAAPPVEPGFLGVFPAELEAEEKEEFGAKSGVILREIVRDSPAEKAGLNAGDIIVHLDGKTIRDLDTFRDVILDKGAGSKMKVGFLRDGKTLWRTVTLASRHAVEEERAERPVPEKKEEPKRDRTEKELREKTRKFLERKESEKREKALKQEEEEKRRGIPGLDFLALDDEAFGTIRGMLEQFGMDADQYFEQGEDGKWRPSGELTEMFKQFDLPRFFEQFRENMPKMPGLEQPKDLLPKEKAPKKIEKEKAPKKIEKKGPEKLELLKVEKKTAPKKSGWIGIVPVELSEEEALELKLYKGVGMVVTEVIEGSPAEKAGLKAGDVITYINGKPLMGEEALIAFVRSSHVGQKATFSVLREGKKKKFRVTLGERKE